MVVFEEATDLKSANECTIDIKYPVKKEDCPEFNFPPDQSVNLCNEEYAGPLNFEVLIFPNEQTKTPWEFSSKLNKIFIGINQKFPVAFSLKIRPQGVPLFVRATPVYSQAQHFQELVHRCIGHEHPQDPLNKDIPSHVLQHVIRCSNFDCRYFGDKNKKERLSVVLPLSNPQPGTDTVKELFHFVCKNSCPSGMNRKPFEVVFSLEDETGNVYGRRIVSVRVCSCPKRDKTKEEKEVDSSANDSNPSPPRGKKRRLPKEEKKDLPEINVDTRIFQLNINIVGKQNQQELLRFSRSLMAAEIVKLEGRHGADLPFRRCFREIDNAINNGE